jgi:hypothetical protein
MKRFANYVDDEIDTGLDQKKKDAFRKKKSLVEKYENQSDFLNNHQSPDKSPNKIV